MNELRTANSVLSLVEYSHQPGRFLLEWHEAWRCFMFPVTRPRHVVDHEWGVDESEQPLAAAIRATAEACGICVRAGALERFRGAVSATAVSGTCQQVTGYAFDVFRYRLAEDTRITPRGPVQWLTLEDIIDPDVGPVSVIAREVSRQVLERSFDYQASEADADVVWEPTGGAATPEPFAPATCC